MSQSVARFRLKPWLLACGAGATLLAAPSMAQTRKVDGEKILELLVKRGVITQDDADTIVAQAEVVPAAAPAPIAGGVAADGTQTIPYVPQVVRDQIIQQVRSELGTQAEAQGWIQPGQVSEWTKRLTFSGDIRARADGMMLADDNFDQFLNWSDINAGEGYQANPKVPGPPINPPYLNSTRDRWAMRLRARLGVKAKISDSVSAELRIATGNDPSPVSTNQTLGAHGEFGKYAVWLDRANVHITPAEDVDVNVGRFANPFWVSTLQFDEDVNFDGISLSAKAKIGERMGVFATAGFFPLFNTSMNFGSRDVGAFGSKDRYMAAGQVGMEFRPSDRLRARVASSYFRFAKVQGEFSSPCNFNQESCDTDATRPTFQQFGNTMRVLRIITPDPSLPQGTSPEMQYFGLASKFEVVGVRGEVDFGLSDRLSARFEADYIKNIAFNRSAVARYAFNNFGANVGGVEGGYDGGDAGWQARFSIGHLGRGAPQGDQSIHKGDWNAHIGYRRLASDATLDALADSDFGLGGTNMKGWFLGGAYGVVENTALGLRWLSANEVAGPPLAVDHLMIDLTTRF